MRYEEGENNMNNFKESLKSDYPEIIHQLATENKALKDALSQIPEHKRVIYDDMAGKYDGFSELWECQAEIVNIGLKCQDILQHSLIDTEKISKNNEKLKDLLLERQEIERCVNLICSELRDYHERGALKGNLILRNM